VDKSCHRFRYTYVHIPGLPDGIYIFKPKIPIWVRFGGSCNGRFWYNLCPFGLHILRQFGIFLVIWYIFPCLGMLPQEKSDNPDIKILYIIKKSQAELSLRLGAGVAWE
jgi:hypothetical protein